ncbi:MAG: hypothetical protein JW839_17230 [Candidatus Lokiarchaeota archaeon]|nr:hypothetical protein [Candidatus Lokiarchaeota archaeon]
MSVRGESIRLIGYRDDLGQDGFELRLIQKGISSLREIQGLESYPKLTSLIVPMNNIASLDGIEHLVNLRHLSIPDNILTSLEGVEHLKMLEKLSAMHNRIDLIRANTFSGLKHLQTIDISGNNITSFPVLEGVPALCNLMLDGNKLTRVPVLPEILRHEKCYIDVSGNPIKDVTKEEAEFILAFGPQEDPALVASVDWSDGKLINFLYWEIRGNLERCAELYADGYKDDMDEYITARQLSERRGFTISHHSLSPFARGRLNIYVDAEILSRWEELRQEAKRMVERQTSPKNRDS